MHKRSVLFFAPSYTRDIPRGLRIQNMIKYLENDYNVHILAFDYNISFEQSAYHLHIMEHRFVSKILNKNIFFPSLTNTIRGKFLGLYNLIISKFLFPDKTIIEKQKIIAEILALHKQYNFEIIVGVANPYTSFLIGKELKENGLDFKWVVDIGDPFLENSIANFSKRKKKKVESFEQSTLAYADAIIVTNSLTKKMYKEKYQKLSKKEIAVIPQGADIVLQDKKSQVPNSKFTLVYAGIFYPKIRDPYELFKAIKQWKEPCIFKIYGMVNIYGLQSQKIHFMGRVSHNKVIDAYNDADALVFIDNAFGLQTSGKIFELLAMQKPILFVSDNTASPTKELLGEHNFVFFTKNSAKNIEQTLQSIKENKDKFIFDFDIDSVSWKRRAETYAKLLEKVSNNKS